MRHWADVPDVVEDVARIADQERGKLAVVVPGAGDGLLVDFLALLVEEERLEQLLGVLGVLGLAGTQLLVDFLKRVFAGLDVFVFVDGIEIPQLVQADDARIPQCRVVNVAFVDQYFAANDATSSM